MGVEFIESKGYKIDEIQNFVMQSKNSTDEAFGILRQYISTFNWSEVDITSIRQSEAFSSVKVVVRNVSTRFPSIRALVSFLRWHALLCHSQADNMLNFAISSSTGMLKFISHISSIFIEAARGTIDFIVFIGALFFFTQVSHLLAHIYLSQTLSLFQMSLS